MESRVSHFDERLMADFMRGLTILGLARKYGRTVAQIESILRKAL